MTTHELGHMQILTIILSPPPYSNVFILHHPSQLPPVNSVINMYNMMGEGVWRSNDVVGQGGGRGWGAGESRVFGGQFDI